MREVLWNPKNKDDMMEVGDIVILQGHPKEDDILFLVVRDANNLAYYRLLRLENNWLDSKIFNGTMLELRNYFCTSGLKRIVRSYSMQINEV